MQLSVPAKAPANAAFQGKILLELLFFHVEGNELQHLALTLLLLVALSIFIML